MSNGVNEVTLIGNLGVNPDVRKTSGGTSVANFSLATNEKRGDKDYTEWHRVVVWGKLAETCGEFLTKGRQVHVKGRLRTRSYDDKNGVKRYVTEIHASTVTFLGSRPQTAEEAPAVTAESDEELAAALGL